MIYRAGAGLSSLFTGGCLGYSVAMLDLYAASRDDLIRIVREQREALARQEALLAQQQRELTTLRAANEQLAHRVGELAQRVRELEGTVKLSSGS